MNTAGLAFVERDMNAHTRLAVSDLSPDQLECYNAIKTWMNRGAATKRTLTLGGYAGSGKSALVSVIAHEMPSPLAFCAFTGKASSVLGRKLQTAGIATVNRIVRKSDGGAFEPRPYCGTIHGLVYRPCDICMKEDVHEHTYGAGCRETQYVLAGDADPPPAFVPNGGKCLACDPPPPVKREGPCHKCGGARYLRRDALDRAYKLLVIDECFHYAQRVLTEDGWQTIGKLVTNRVQCRVWSLNKSTGQLELKPIVRWLKKPAPEKLLRIDVGRTDSMRAARVIRCTAAHKILTPNGYVRAGDLVVGEDLVVRGRHLTGLQFSMLVGSMLGDGSMNRQSGRNSPQPRFTQGEDQIDWLKFKRSVFGEDMCGPIHKGASGYGPKAVWNFNLKVTDQARRVAEEMPRNTDSKNGRRYWTPTDIFLSWIDEAALAFWYLDDGSLSRMGNRVTGAQIHSECFDEQTNGRLAAFLEERFGLKARVQRTKSYWCLSFNVREARKLLGIVTPFIPACMARKAPGACFNPPFVPAGETTVAPIRSITTVAGRGYGMAHVYDLEVADHHNYIAGNVVVSNCSMVSDEMLQALLSYNVPILAVGDHGQLPPVKGQGSLMRKPDLRLEKIHRQAEKSPIIALSKRIRETGDIDDTLEDGEAFTILAKRDLKDWIAKRWATARLAADPRTPAGALGSVLVTATNRARCNLNYDVREALGIDGPPSKGEPVICLKNAAPIYNGMRGVLTADAVKGAAGSAPKWKMTVDFVEDGQTAENVLASEHQFFAEKTIDYDAARALGVTMSNLGALYDFGYSLTCHKMQGSQAPEVGVVFENMGWMTRDDRTRWAYTAATRAQSKLCVIRG